MLHLAWLAAAAAIHRVIQVQSLRNTGEECVSQGGRMYLTSSDLELATDSGCASQVVGIVFHSVALSRADAADLANAHVVFDIDEVHARSSQPLTLRIFGERHVSATEPSSAPRDFSLACGARTRDTPCCGCC
jgi:hypothetical protein